MRSISRAVVWAFVVSATAVLATLVEAEPITYRIDRDVTQVEYVAHAFGVIHQRGRFADMRGTIVLDQAMERGGVDFDIDARSVDSGWNLRDAFLLGEPMLDAGRHPRIHFQSQRLVFRDGRLARIEGALTLRGVTQDVTLTVTHIACANSLGDASSPDCKADAVTTIRRSAFGMDSFAPFLGDEVDLQFSVVARRTADVVTGR
ncbi:MAG TPA: YceI family protein [Casimicrobiaceae bacterium]|nr:YceI family protein [Casimicrobiaceae bacterium]